ncbi:MAG: helix-turn-helix domain-containing protein [Phocaeicola sp.]
MKERIASVITKEGITAAQFAEKIGISASSLSHILSGRNNPSLEVVMKIHKACSYVHLNWLLYGEGEMETTASGIRPENLAYNGDENSLFPPNGHVGSENAKDSALETPNNGSKELVIEKVKYVEVASKKITEIRIFFDNGTYETFRPDAK